MSEKDKSLTAEELKDMIVGCDKDNLYIIRPAEKREKQQKEEDNDE